MPKGDTRFEIDHLGISGRAPACVLLRLGPLDGLAIDFGPRNPERPAMDLSPKYGGPGVAYYELERHERSERYQFIGWLDRATRATPPPL